MGQNIVAAHMNLIAEERVETFMATGDQRDLIERPTVRPDPKITLAVLCNTNLQTILPVECLPAASAHATGRFTEISRWLQKNSSMILSCGLILFIVLCGYEQACGVIGLAQAKPVGIIALLIGLSALGFVWSKRSLQRESVEYNLQLQLAAEFRSANNLKRAAPHQHKADELKSFR
jgi:hypothetical protein